VQNDNECQKSALEFSALLVFTASHLLVSEPGGVESMGQKRLRKGGTKRGKGVVGVGMKRGSRKLRKKEGRGGGD
jgi:hypothetical protein